MKVALLAGGNSSEREISLQSAEQVKKAFDRDKYEVFLIDVKGVDWSYEDAHGGRYSVDKSDFSITVNACKHKFDYAFIIIHGTPGEDGRLQGYLDIVGVPYSSCGMVSSVVTFEKELCKRIVSGVEGVNLAKEVFIRKGDKVSPSELVARLGLPMFIKPNASGSSCGVSKVKAESEIEGALAKAFKESDSVLVEEFISGREFGCGVLITKDKEYILPVTEIISKNDFFDYEAKYTSGYSDEITPAEISPQLTTQLQESAARIYKACGCSGVVRVDFIVTGKGVPYMIEVNSIPGMSAGSIVPKQLAAAGITMTELIDIIIADR